MPGGEWQAEEGQWPEMGVVSSAGEQEEVGLAEPKPGEARRRQGWSCHERMDHYEVTVLF